MNQSEMFYLLLGFAFGYFAFQYRICKKKTPPLTQDEIWHEFYQASCNPIKFAKAILRKAQEK